MDRDLAQGFTLVELMVVVAIVAVLAALAVPALRAGTEDEFNRATRELNLDVMAAKSYSLSRRENHVIRITGGNAYELQGYFPDSKPTVWVDPPERKATLPAVAKIVQIRQCADTGPAPCAGPVGVEAELRFLNTGELESCLGNKATCDDESNRDFKSVTIDLQGHRRDGTADPKLRNRIVIYTSTGHIKLLPY